MVAMLGNVPKALSQIECLSIQCIYAYTSTFYLLKMPSKKRASTAATPKSARIKQSLTSQLDAIVAELNRTVPSAIQKNFGLIQRLDALCHEAEIDRQLDKRTLVSISQLKEDLAKQTYELLDQQARKLDKSLAKFDLITDETVKAKIGALDEQRRGRRSMSGGGTSLNMEVDPSEPTYCICGQVAFGEMISCDGPDCEKEWFHIQCVGKPENTSSWFCPDCTRKMANKLQQAT